MLMNLKDAQRTIARYYKSSDHSDIDNFEFEEASQFQYQYYLNNVQHDASLEATIYNLGMHYFNLEAYELSLKYIKLACKYSTLGYSTLGDFYYYGLSVPIDYKKAYECYMKANVYRNSKLKIADMYRYGYYVTKDIDTFVDMIIDIAYLYDETLLKFPDIVRRLGDVYYIKNEYDLAIKLYLYAKDGYKDILKTDLNFVNINEIRDTIISLYELIEFNKDCFDLYDCFYYLDKPSTVYFTYQSKKHKFKTFLNNNQLIVSMDNNYYHSFNSLLLKAKINNHYLTSISDKLEDFSIKK